MSSPARILLFTLFAFIGPSSLASAETGVKSAKYEGVASCASSNCHGSVAPRIDTNVLQNEYTTWSKHDLHSRAWIALTTAQGKKIGEHLGISAPEKDPQCLSCHATYDNDSKRFKPEFKIEDGVGCESCHGAAENYLAEHATRSATHSGNVANGMKDLTPLAERAKVCLSCHYGSENASVTHRLMGAGHPRLSFELDTFTVLQPQHWKPDADYTARKGRYNSARAWLIGQAAFAGSTIATLSSPQRTQSGPGPEFTILTCYSCHHSLSQKQWNSRSYGGHPGEFYLNLAALFTVEHALRNLGFEEAEVLKRQTAELHKAFREGRLNAAAQHIKVTIEQAQKHFALVELSSPVLKKLSKGMAHVGAEHTNLQYEYAEQIVMALSSILAEYSPNGHQFGAEIKLMYATLNSPSEFNSTEFSAACRKLLEKI